jgi:excisionase family DNA binding protein
MDNNQLQIAVVPMEFLSKMEYELKEMKSLLAEKAEEDIKSQWLDSAEARKMLGVSQKTWQTYRDKRIIPFSQFGRKIMVKRSDLEAFLEGNIVQK